MSYYAGAGSCLPVPVDVPSGGTGVTSITQYALIEGDGVNTVNEIAPGTDGQLLIAATGGGAIFATLASAGSTVVFTAGANSLNIETGGAIPSSFVSDVGTATPALGVLNVLALAGGNIATSGAGNTLSVAVAGTTQYGVQVGNAAGSLDSLAVGTTNTVLLGNTAGNPSWGQVDLTTDVTGILPVQNGGTGNSTLTDHGLLLGSGVGAVTPLGVAGNGEIPIGSAGVDPVLGNITSTRDLEVTNGAGTIDMTLTENVHRTAIHGWNGAIIESPVVTVTAAGGVITFSVEKSGGGNLTVVFSDGFYNWTTTPADTITLTAGSDTSPQINYVYFLQSTKLLTVSTSAWPVTEHAPLATVLCQTAASLQTDGAYKVHAWTDHVTSSDDQGHIAHLNYWIRHQNATWQSGIAQTLTITPQGAAPDNVIFTNASGTVLQLHDHTFPAFAGTPDIYTANDSVTPYNLITDLNALLTDSIGGSMSGRYFSLVVWAVISEDTGDCKLMVNLPTGSYGTATRLLRDANKYTNFSIPSDFKGTGFLLYQMNLRHQTLASGTWTSILNVDLRGLFPGTAAGGSVAFSTEFEDNAFRILDDGDNTKEIAFQADQITTANTRVITMCDQDLSLISPSFPGTVTTGGNIELPTTNAALTEGVIEFNSTRYFHAYGTGNLFIGSAAGNGTTSGTGKNVGIGAASLDALTTGHSNMGIGSDALTDCTEGVGNIAIGADVLEKVTDGDYNIGIGFVAAPFLTTGVRNTCVGVSALGGAGVTSASYNCCIGNGSGSSLTTTDSDNITVMNTGTATDNNTTRIGTQGTGDGQQDKTFIAGIYDTTPAGGNDGTVIIDSNGQLGSVAAAMIVRVDSTSSTQAIVVNTEYTTNHGAALLTYTLPATAAVGDIIEVVGSSANGWTIAQNASQTIHHAGSSTTTGVGGSLSSSARYDCVRLKCIVTSTDFVVQSFNGTLTVA